jgi:uncharacterized protein YndB with AHSA1/START domain
MTSSSPGVIRVTHAFMASAERVFDAWINPEKVARWLLPDTEGKARPVGVGTGADEAIRCIAYCAGRAVEHTVEYLEIQRPYRLSFTIRNSASAKKERVTVLIEPRGAGCFLTLTSRIEYGPLRALTRLAALTPFPAEKAARPRWPTVEAKAALSLGLHLAMLPLLPIVLREPELPPGAASPPPLAIVTVDLATADGVLRPHRSYVPAVMAPGEPPAMAPRPPTEPPAPSETTAAVPEPWRPPPIPAPQTEALSTPASTPARPVPHTTTSRNTLPLLASRTSRQPNPDANNQGASTHSPDSQALTSLGAPPQWTNEPNLTTRTGGAAGEDRGVLGHQTRAAAQAEPPLVGTSCIGTVSFSTDGNGTYYGGKRVSVEARFFRDQYGGAWIRFTLWPGAPWNLPVTIAGNEIRWTGVNGSGYALRPMGNNHLVGLAGFNIDSAAKIDFTCAGSDAHPT